VVSAPIVRPKEWPHPSAPGRFVSLEQLQTISEEEAQAQRLEEGLWESVLDQCWITSKTRWNNTSPLEKSKPREEKATSNDRRSVVSSTERIRRNEETVVNICPWDQIEEVGDRKERNNTPPLTCWSEQRIQNSSVKL